MVLFDEGFSTHWLLSIFLSMIYTKSIEDIKIKKTSESGKKIIFVEVTNDVDGDGEVTILDIVLIVNCILSNDCDECSDWNYDGSVDILDIILMINIILEP